MLYLRMIVCLTLAFVGAAPALAQSRGAPGLDVLNPQMTDSLPWDAIEETPIWVASQPVYDEIVGADFGGLVTQREDYVRLAGERYRVTFQRSDAGDRHRIGLIVVTSARVCGSLRQRLVQAYGPPAAARQTDYGSRPHTVVFDDAQWRLKNTAITQECTTITTPGDRLMILTIDLDPVADAGRLDPVIRLNCPGVEAESTREGRALPNSFIVDPYNLWLRTSTGDALAQVRLSGTELSFHVAEGRTLRIDQAAKTYRVSGGDKPERRGSCL